MRAIDEVAPRLVFRGRLCVAVVAEDHSDLKNVSSHFVCIHRQFVFAYSILTVM